MIDIHGFSDAFMTAYVACVYLSRMNKNGKDKINFLYSKVKVAPLKCHNISRNELCGAILLIKVGGYR